MLSPCTDSVQLQLISFGVAKFLIPLDLKGCRCESLKSRNNQVGYNKNIYCQQDCITFNYNLMEQNIRLRVVSNFGDCDCGAGKIHTRARERSSPRNFARARVHFACPTIAIAKIRDYSQSSKILL